jgi:hypothetical protein
MHLQFKRGVCINSDAEIAFSQPGLRQYWEIYSTGFDEDFRREIAPVIERHDEAAAQQGAAADSA